MPTLSVDLVQRQKLQTILKAMLPYDKSFDHYKYLSWGFIYLIDTLRLPEVYPQVFEHFMDGKHTVSRLKWNSWFDTVSTDMASKQTLNKDCKTKCKGAKK